MNDKRKSEMVRQIACGLSVRAAAKAAGVSDETAYTWLEEPEVKGALNALDAAADDEVTEFRNRVRRSAGLMLDKLIELAGGAAAALPGAAPQPVSAATQLDAARTFFKEVHQPLFAPRPAQPGQPMVFVNAEQAQLLFAQPMQGGQGSQGGSGNGRNQPPPASDGGAAHPAGANRHSEHAGNPAADDARVALVEGPATADHPAGPHDDGVEGPAGEGLVGT